MKAFLTMLLAAFLFSAFVVAAPFQGPSATDNTERHGVSRGQTSDVAFENDDINNQHPQRIAVNPESDCGHRFQEYPPNDFAITNATAFVKGDYEAGRITKDCYDESTAYLEYWKHWRYVVYYEGVTLEDVHTAQREAEKDYSHGRDSKVNHQGRMHCLQDLEKFVNDEACAHGNCEERSSNKRDSRFSKRDGTAPQPQTLSYASPPSQYPERTYERFVNMPTMDQILDGMELALQKLNEEKINDDQFDRAMAYYGNWEEFLEAHIEDRGMVPMNYEDVEKAMSFVESLYREEKVSDPQYCGMMDACVDYLLILDCNDYRCEHSAPDSPNFQTRSIGPRYPTISELLQRRVDLAQLLQLGRISEPEFLTEMEHYRLWDNLLASLQQHPEYKPSMQNVTDTEKNAEAVWQAGAATNEMYEGLMRFCNDLKLIIAHSTDKRASESALPHLHRREAFFWPIPCATKEQCSSSLKGLEKRHHPDLPWTTYPTLDQLQAFKTQQIEKFGDNISEVDFQLIKSFVHHWVKHLRKLEKKPDYLPTYHDLQEEAKQAFGAFKHFHSMSEGEYVGKILYLMNVEEVTEAERSERYHEATAYDGEKTMQLEDWLEYDHQPETRDVWSHHPHLHPPWSSYPTREELEEWKQMQLGNDAKGATSFAKELWSTFTEDWLEHLEALDQRPDSYLPSEEILHGEADLSRQMYQDLEMTRATYVGHILYVMDVWRVTKDARLERYGDTSDYTDSEDSELEEYLSD